MKSHKKTYRCNKKFYFLFIQKLTYISVYIFLKITEKNARKSNGSQVQIMQKMNCIKYLGIDSQRNVVSKYFLIYWAESCISELQLFGNQFTLSCNPLIHDMVINYIILRLFDCRTIASLDKRWGKTSDIFRQVASSVSFCGYSIK